MIRKKNMEALEAYPDARTMIIDFDWLSSREDACRRFGETLLEILLKNLKS